MCASQIRHRILIWIACSCLAIGVQVIGGTQAFGQSITKAPFPNKMAAPMPKLPDFQSQPNSSPLPTPQVPQIPVIVPPRVHSMMPPPVNPIDLTPQFQFSFVPPGTIAAVEGIKQVDRFPSSENVREGVDVITINAAQGARFNKSAAYAVDFEDGEILVSLHKPSRLGFVRFALGEIALAAGTDILIKKVDGVYRITNFTGLGEKLKIKLTGDAGHSGVSAQNDKVIALASGYELIIGSSVLKRSDIRIADGCARRQFQALAGGKVAVCEICTQTVLTSSAIIVSMVQAPGDKSGRLLSNLSKMAAVLNNMNGTDGYTIEPAVSAMVKR